MGFVFVEQGFSAMFIPICISISICCSGTGFFYQTRGLKHGRSIVVSTCAAVASIVTGVVAGMLALGEKLPTSQGNYIISYHPHQKKKTKGFRLWEQFWELGINI